ncbi:hypothetical protein PIROE2DRAFT_48375, partial [Piromyces sp. E2]
MYASQNGNLSIVNYLIEHGADVNLKSKCQDSNDSHSPILFDRIIYRFKKLKNNQEYGWTALMCAAQSGHLDIVECLCDHEALISERNNRGYDALMIAAENGHLDILQFLHQKGLSIHGRNKKHMT